MKTMKNLLLSLSAAGLVYFAGCTVDPCKDVTCLNGGVCLDGNCVCDEGYEGTDCATVSAAKFTGTFIASDVCTTGPYAYTATITQSTANEINVLIANFGGFGGTVTVTATADEENLTIPSQTISGNRTIQGSGFISTNGNTISISYTVTPAVGPVDNCSGTWTRQ